MTALLTSVICYLSLVLVFTIFLTPGFMVWFGLLLAGVAIRQDASA